jgi:hypothetical protein
MRTFAPLGMALLLCPALVGAAVQDPEPELQGAFEVDLTVQHATLDEAGVEYGPGASPVRFTLKRTRTAAGWRLVMSADDTAVGAPKNSGPVSPFAGGRIEIDDDNSPPRIYNARGDRVFADLPIPGLAAATAMTLTDGLIARASSEATAARRRALERAFGPASRGRGALDRFVRVDGDRTEELIVDAATALPREVVVRREGAIEARTTLDYQRRTDGDYVRSGLVTEAPLPGRRGHKTITRTTVTRVRLGEGR